MSDSNWNFGLLAEFEESEQLVHAVKRAREGGYARMEAYSPFPVEGLAEALGFTRTWMPLVVLLGGVFGGCGGYYLQYWISVIDYPVNVGGRPLHSWPAFIPVTFECTILAASLAGVLGMLALNGLPRPHHPLFNVEAFQHASVDRFFLCIQAADPKYHEATTRAFLESLEGAQVYDVPFYSSR